MVAAEQGFEQIVDLLLEQGASPTCVSTCGRKTADFAKTRSIFYTLQAKAIDF